jgi:hypothetical protein
MLTIVKKNDSYDVITYQLENEDNSLIDLTGASVNFVMGKKNKLITNASAIITSATSGIVSYQLTANDTLVSGTFLAEFVVTFANGTQKTYPSNGYITVDIEQNLDTTQNNVVVDTIAAKQGDFEAKLDSILKQGIGTTVSAMNEYTWVATAGQTVFVFPTNAHYDPSAKWFQVSVGNVPVDNALVNRLLSTQFSLNIDPSYIAAGVNVRALWVEPIVPITGGHHTTHEINGQDEIDVTKLRNYNEQIGTPITSMTSDIARHDKKVKGVVSINDYGTLNADGLTSDQTVIANAVADCYTNGYVLDWGNNAKTYLTTANILNFHKITHIGNAKILRGTDTFYINPTSSQTNRIYVGVSGASNTFDGLSPSQPVAKLQTAMDWVANYGPVLSGFWEINMTAGTFSRAKLQDGLLMQNYLTIKGVDVGGHPNVPTTIISEGMGISASGIYASSGSEILVKDIKLVGYNGTSSSNGIAVSYNCSLKTSNVHTDSCYWGISGTSQSYTAVPDGIHSNCGFLNGDVQISGTGAAFRSLQQNNHYYGDQNASDVTNGAIIKNCSMGILAQEMSTGHANWITIQDCGDGAKITVSSRINGDGILFKRNSRAVRIDSSSHFGQTSNTVFATGVDVNGVAIVRLSGAQKLDAYSISGYEMTYSITENTYEMKKVGTTYTQTTAQTYHTSVLKAPFWMTQRSSIVIGKRIRFKVFGTLTGATSNKRVNIRLTDGTTQGFIGLLFQPADSGAFVAEGEIYFYDSNQQYIRISGSRTSGATVKHSTVFSTCDATKDITLTLETYVDTAGDSVTIDFVELTVAG